MKGELKFKKHSGRLNHNPNTPGKMDGDHTGHLIADRFGGSHELDNLVSQTKKVNLSEYKVLENKWANSLEEGKTVIVDIKVEYDTGGVRPKLFRVHYTIDGVNFKKVIDN